MGNTPQSFNLRRSQSQEAQNEHSSINVYQEEYFQAYEKVRSYHKYFSQFLHESPNFGQNLQYLFPNALKSPLQYFEMAMYLRKYDPIIKSSIQAQENCVQSTLLDRFFMLCLGNLTYEKYKIAKLSIQRIESLMLDYYKLFVKDPKLSSMSKVLKYIQIQQLFDQNEEIQVRKFAEKFREYFPLAHKYLRDYYMAKFHEAQKQFRILQFFNSQILSDDAVVLALRMPQLESQDISQLYNSDYCGTSFYTLSRRLVGYTGPWLLLVKHSEKNIQGKKETYVFGTYQSGPVKDIFGYQGDLSGFMFTIEPQIKYLTTDTGEGGQNYFFISIGNSLLTKFRKGLGFGGSNDLKNFKLWIDEDLDKSTVQNGYDMTYGYGSLAGPTTEKLRIQRIEIWGLGTQQNLKDQLKYWAQRDAQKTRQRRVNKRQLFEESELFLENLLAYQDQIAQVDKLEKRRSPLKRSPIKKRPLKGKQNEGQPKGKQNEIQPKGKQHILIR